MATRKYKSKKHLSKKHGKKSKSHKKHVKKTRKYRKKRGGDQYFPQYEDIVDTLDKIGKGNKSEETAVPGQFSDKKTQMKPTDMLDKYLDMKNPVSCGRRALIGDKQNCDDQKKKLYTNIVQKIKETEGKINNEVNNSVTDEEVNTINKILKKAEEHFGSKLTSHA